MVKRYKKPDVFELVKLHQKTNVNYFTTLKDYDYFNWNILIRLSVTIIPFIRTEKDNEIQIALVIRKIKGVSKSKIESWTFLVQPRIHMDSMNYLVA